ncbi:MAG: geranylgeranyl reductase family protein [Chloroflexota bacterium]|nr:geranylgeranyl reductase family protein [Chloroflexota bacterium]
MDGYDVVIIGAGPSGTTLGYELARRGVPVLILEKERLPRNKTCAGGVTFRAAELLDFDIDEVTQSIAYGMRISYQLNDYCIKRYRDPFVHSVMRRDFDYLLAQKAQEAGAVVIDGVRAESLDTSGEHVRVVTKKGDFTARIVAGADGASGMVASNTGLMKDAVVELALEAEVSVEENILSDWDSLIGVDLGQIPGGYGWVFPKRQHLSVGVTGPAQLSKRFKSYLESILQQFGEHEVIDFSGHLMPMRRRGSAIQRGGVLLLGDAAGLIHPLSGEGIYYAIRSAQLAAPVIADTLRKDTIDLRGYQRAVDSELMPGLEVGRILLKLFTLSPRFCYTVVKKSDLLWGCVCWALMGSRPAYS